MKFRITNLTGTKNDPRRRNRTSATARPVRIGSRSIPPAKHAFIHLEQVDEVRDQLKFYLAHKMIRVDSPTIDSLQVFMDRLEVLSKEAEVEVIPPPAKKQPEPEPKPKVAEIAEAEAAPVPEKESKPVEKKRRTRKPKKKED
jgi:hypothetical protein